MFIFNLNHYLLVSTTNYTIFPLGDSAITIDFGNIIDSNINEQVINLCRTVTTANLDGVKDVVPAYCSLTIHYDVVAISDFYSGISAFSILKQKLQDFLLQNIQVIKQTARQVIVPVCYAEKWALDYEEIQKLTGLPFYEIVQIHTAKRYKVYMIGFLPGFAYMGEVDEQIAVPRRQEPRVKIEAGYVGIAGKQTGVYPLTSPGGWQIIGRTPLKLFDKSKEEPVFFNAGDEVQFFSITEDEFENY